MNQPQANPKWFEPYHNVLVGFVVQTRHGDYLPIIGRCHESPGDADCFIDTVAKNERQATLESALALLDVEQARLHRIFRRPNRGTGMTWLLGLVQNEGMHGEEAGR